MIVTHNRIYIDTQFSPLMEAFWSEAFQIPTTELMFTEWKQTLTDLGIEREPPSQDVCLPRDFWSLHCFSSRINSHDSMSVSNAKKLSFWKTPFLYYRSIAFWTYPSLKLGRRLPDRIYAFHSFDGALDQKLHRNIRKWSKWNGAIRWRPEATITCFQNMQLLWKDTRMTSKPHVPAVVTSRR